MFFNRSKKRSTVLSILLAFLVCFFPMTFTLPTSVQAATTLTTYPAPAGATLNTDFTVKVRVPGGAWQDLDEYRTRIGAPTRATYASFVYFDTDGPVELSVTYTAGTVTSAEVRPSHHNITPAINGNTMTFTISGPQKLVFDVNGNVDNDLMIFANPLEVNPPSPTDPDVIYLGPGVYNQNFIVPSGKTLYVAGGAVIRGQVNLNNATNAKVIGRGVLDLPASTAVDVNFANNITVDGIILNDYNNANSGGNGILIGNSTNVTVNNVKVLAFQRWSDGIDSYCVSNVSINDVFVRTGDDSISVYASRWGFSGNTTNLSVTNSILMPGKAHPINIGTHGNPGSAGGGDMMDTLNFSNLDILTYNPLSAGLPLQTSLTASDGSLISDVNFTDIRIDDAVVNKFIDIKTFKNQGFGLGVGRGINNVYFKNISYTGTNSNVNEIFGNSSARLTQDVTFENLKVNGNVVQNAAGGNFSIGNFVSNINFIASGATPPSTTPIPHYVPINLALKKAASADSFQAGNPAANGNDGNDATRWTANDGNTGHSWTVDLGSSMNITRGTQVKWEFGGGGYKYKIETSNDNTNWKLKVDKTNNTSTDQTQSDIFYDTARYVRITVTGLPSIGWASFSDFMVFGDPTNLALNKTASADSSQTTNPASNGNDGNTATSWIANDGLTGHWWKVDLGSSKNITGGAQVMWQQPSSIYSYTIDTSTDNTNWTTVIDRTNNMNDAQVYNNFFTGTARYVRVTATGLPSGINAGISDFKVFGDTGETVPLAQLPFDEARGTTANDTTGNGWNGTLTGGASFVAGNNGNAVDLAGTNGYVSLPTGVVSNASTATISAWVYLDSASNWTRIFDFGTGTSTNMFLTPKNGVNGKIRFAIKVNNSSEQIIDGQAALPTGGWHHVAVTLDGLTGTLYVDGAQVGINTGMTLKPSDLGATSKNWIGRSQYSDPYLDGRVDDFRIYNRALTISEVMHLKNGQSVFPIAELPFDGTTGTTATDVTGNGWDGRLVGGASWVTGNSGNAVSLSGTNQYVALPAGVVSSADTLTVAAWVNLNTMSNWTRIFDFGSGSTNYMFLSPKNGSTGKIRFVIKSASSSEEFIDGTAALAGNGWHHVAVTLNGSTGTLYVDGQQVGSNTAMTITPTMLGTTTQNWIGRSQFSTDPYLNGLVDGFRIYNRALSVSEVLAD